MSIFSKLKSKIHEIIWESDLLSARFSIAIGSLFWAALLWWPGVLFTPQRTTYRLMSEIASEDMWGLAFFIHGVFAFTTLLTDIKGRIMFAGDAAAGAIIWTTATTTCFASHWMHSIIYAPPAAMSAELSLMLASWWYLIRWIVRFQQENKIGC
jgi:hypothetical protein